MKSPPVIPNPPPLPLINGVSASRQWLPAGAWPTVLAYLAERFPGISADTWQQRMARGLVTDDTGAQLQTDSPYRVGACIYYYREVGPEPRLPVEVNVLFEDEHLLVADKPHFLPVAPSGRYVQETLLTRLRQTGGRDDLVPIHRIDRETAGLVLCSVNPATRDAYTALFRTRRIEKTYEAIARTRHDLDFPLTRRSLLVAGEPFFRMQEAPGEANAETRIDVLEAGEALSRYRIALITGRKHQIRVHFAALGMPILNDRFYPEVRNDLPDDLANPLKLLARSVSFHDPLSGQWRQFSSAREL